MKKLFIISFILFFISCQKQHIDRTVQTCDFGLKTFNLIKRSASFVDSVNAYNKKRNPHKPPPVDTTCTPQPGSNTPYVYLVFSGGTTSGTSWGSLNLTHSGLTDEQITECISSVREDFKAFNVVIDTSKAIYDNTVPGKKMMCFVTEYYSWYGTNAGGVAFIGSYQTDGAPCFVFSTLLGYNTKYIKEAISHEVGHTLGLYHYYVYDANCNYLDEYNKGCCGQAPIMGIAYYQPNGYWHPNIPGQYCKGNDSSFIKNVFMQ